MQTLTIDFISSLDGFSAAEGWPGFWGVHAPEYLDWLGTAEEGSHATLMGATTYRLMSGMAAEAGDDPGFASLTATPKYVFSSTLEEPLSWANSTLVSGDAVAAVRELKRAADRPLRTLGSVSLCRSFVTAGVVDRFRTVIFPVVNGATGRDPIFAGYPDLALELVQSRTFDNRLQLLEYAPTVLDGPPASA
jgi:dihydrofolate reductase